MKKARSICVYLVRWILASFNLEWRILYHRWWVFQTFLCLVSGYGDIDNVMGEETFPTRK